MAGSWIILRMAGRSTLGLAESLNAAGFEVWTPVEVKSRRLPRSQRREDQAVPMLPTFIFARSEAMADLHRLANTARKPHADFSLFKYQDRAPIISDAALEPLREVERRTQMAREKALRAKAKPPAFKRGQSVTLPGGAFAGMSGRVETQKGRSVVVCFGRMSIEVDAWQIVPDGASSARIAA